MGSGCVGLGGSRGETPPSARWTTRSLKCRSARSGCYRVGLGLGWGRARRPPPAPTGHCRLQKEVAKMYSSFQVMYTVGYSLSLGALLLALATLLGLRYTH